MVALLTLSCAAPGIPGVYPEPPPLPPGWKSPPADASDPGADTSGTGAAEPGLPGAAGPVAVVPAAPRAFALAPHAPAQAAAQALTSYVDHLAAAEARRADAARSWGLAQLPLRPPAPPEPAEKPRLVGENGLPPVFESVPTDDRVVFLTIDDGAERDPRLLDMLRELEIPFSAFLSDGSAAGGYAYFREAHEQGAGIHNHTVGHPEMPLLSYAEQYHEICRQQDVLTREIGERPTLFRPPYGAYDDATLLAAAACGAEGVPMWTQEAFPDRVDWSRSDGLFYPGDIILTHFRGEGEWPDSAWGDMVDILRRIVDEVTEQGFAIARLEDYV